MNKINPDNKCAHLIKNVEYRNDALQYMFLLQRSLQEHVAENKNQKKPHELTIQEGIDLSIYHWGCTTTEFFEMGERLNDFNWELDRIDPDDKLEIQYEYIDMWHFIMNQFIYSGITEIDLDYTLQECYDLEVSNNYLNLDLFSALTAYWADISYVWGKYLNHLPYKKWKKYSEEDYNNIDKEIQYKLSKVIITVFIKIGILLDIDKEHFFNLYISKNEENIARQDKGGIYHSE